MKQTFTTIDGSEVEIDSSQVTHMKAGDQAETTIVELKGGESHTVQSTEVEIADMLDINPFTKVEPEDDDASMEDFIDQAS